MKVWMRVTLGIIGLISLAGLVALITLLNHGISARDEPTALEAFIARRLRHFAVPRAARQMKNPVPLTPRSLSDGRAHFADHCALCHGNDGRGQTPIGRNLYPKAPDMWLPETQSLSDGELYHIIRNGVRLTGMPAWGEPGSQDNLENWHLVHFIRHLPEITTEELEEMKTMNPRTPREIEEEEEIRRFLAGEDIKETPPKHVH